MPPESPELDRFRQIQEAHRGLMELLDRIGVALEQRTAPIDEVVDMIGQLGDRLIKHFTSEEEDGYFAEALTQAPRLFQRANDLMYQHPKMTESARKLSGSVDPKTSPDLWWEQTAERFESFREELQQHEREEDGLIQEAYVRDIGSHD